MSIKYAILGMLSWKPSTGYDLKKVFEDSPIMYWSGNNNQIYKALVQLLDEGLVTNEVVHQESTPSKKLYTITAAGSAALKEWVLSAPELPEFKKTFLVQLAWADQLDSKELVELLSRYENEVYVQLIMQKEKLRRGINAPNRNPREVFMWDKIYGNVVSSYEGELDWVRNLRKELSEWISE
ncbi:MAG: PadR family transcriptional regulator [Pseudomonadota bacterium]